MNLLAEKQAEEWNLKTSQAIIVIKNSEESRKMHNKQKQFLKPIIKGIKNILVPSPRTNVISKNRDITDDTIQDKVYDPQQVFNILLRQNYRHLLKSENSIFTKSILMQKIGYEAEHEIVEDILKGYNIEIMKIHENNNYGATLQNFMISMARATDEKSDPIPDLQWQYGI